jgi:hypothetical protein
MFNGNTFSNIEMLRHIGMNSIKTVAVNDLYMYSTVALASFQMDNSVLINGILPLPPCCCSQQGGSSRIVCLN